MGYNEQHYEIQRTRFIKEKEKEQAQYKVGSKEYNEIQKEIDRSNKFEYLR